MGIQGLECYYSRYTEKEVRFLLDTAKKYDLLVSGGSDYHGENRGVQLGVGRGGLRVPGWVLEDMKSYRAEEL